jgi:uncharacterized protein (DUF427 family)
VRGLERGGARRGAAHYLPGGESLLPAWVAEPGVLHQEYCTRSRAKSLCPWKGLASYYTVTVDGRANPNAAWYYPHPSPLARKIKNHVAFWNAVQIEESGPRS